MQILARGVEAKMISMAEAEKKKDINLHMELRKNKIAQKKKAETVNKFEQTLSGLLERTIKKNFVKQMMDTRDPRFESPFIKSLVRKRSEF